MKKNDNVQKNNNINDNFFKSLFSVKENLTDLLHDSLPHDVLNGLKIDSLEYDPTEYVDRELTPYFKNISCNMLYGDTNIKISLLYEHKSYPDKNIHLQLLRYILNVWENQVANKQKLTPVLLWYFIIANENGLIRVLSGFRSNLNALCLCLIMPCSIQRILKTMQSSAILNDPV